MTTIPDTLWEWFEATLDANDNDPASVNPDHLAAFLGTKGLRVTFDTRPAPDDTAFDGQYEDPSRALTARERDILCRMLGDALARARHPHRPRPPDPPGMFGRTDALEERKTLEGIRDAIDPRGGD